MVAPFGGTPGNGRPRAGRSAIGVAHCTKHRIGKEYITGLGGDKMLAAHREPARQIWRTGAHDASAARRRDELPLAVELEELLRKAHGFWIVLIHRAAVGLHEAFRAKALKADLLIGTEIDLSLIHI